MNNLYTLWNRETSMFRKADGTMTDNIDQAEQMPLQQAMEKEIELFSSGEKFIELREVPLMHEGQYEDALSLTDPAGDFFDAHGIDLVINIGSGDESTWHLSSRATGTKLSITLADCYSFSVENEGDE